MEAARYCSQDSFNNEMKIPYPTFSLGAALLACALLAVIFAAVLYHAPFNKEEAVAPSPQSVDTSIAQYNDRPNASQIAGAAGAVKNPILVKGCGLKFSFTPASSVVLPGGTFSYTALLSNNGTKTCTNTSFSVYYADQESFISAAPAATAASYYWSVGSLASGKQFSVSIKTKAPLDLGQLNNEACATADNAAGDVCPENTLFVRTTVPNSVAAASTSGTTKVRPQGKEYGTWIWVSPLTMSAAYRETLLSAAKDAGFTSVYVTIDDYLTTNNKGSYDAALAAFVTAAKAKGIAVDAEGGARDWSKAANRIKGYTLIDYVIAYNASHPNQTVRGFQYDVEPYLLPEYETNKASVLSDFVTFIDESAKRMKATDASFSVVIPHFYDAEQGWTPAFSYNGQSAHAFTQLLKVLQQKGGSKIIVMAYRNFFDGDDGIDQLVEPELQEASNGNYSTSVIVAEETGNVDPSYVTFHGKSKNDFLSAVATIYSSFQNNARFGGVAVHYLDTYLSLH
jgi:hypothetical protein